MDAGPERARNRYQHGIGYRKNHTRLTPELWMNGTIGVGYIRFPFCAAKAPPMFSLEVGSAESSPARDFRTTAFVVEFSFSFDVLGLGRNQS